MIPHTVDVHRISAQQQVQKCGTYGVYQIRWYIWWYVYSLCTLLDEFCNFHKWKFHKYFLDYNQAATPKNTRLLPRQNDCFDIQYFYNVRRKEEKCEGYQCDWWLCVILEIFPSSINRLHLLVALTLHNWWTNINAFHIPLCSCRQVHNFYDYT